MSRYLFYLTAFVDVLLLRISLVDLAAAAASYSLNK